MNGEEPMAAVSRLMSAGSAELSCDEAGHPDGHTCLAVPEGTDVDGLVEKLTQRYSRPFTQAGGLPPLPLAEQAGWTHTWIWDERAAALGRGPDGRPVLAVAERNMPHPDELPAGMPWVDRLVAITGGIPSPVPAPDWAAVESRLGTPLPSDYRRLVETGRFECTATEFLFRQMADPDHPFFTKADHLSGHWFMRFLRES
ncbi:hypothetical protein [Spirillospora sp. NPDC048819]|uniref:hypothetical protein n=1 Tax=Spirillospora sp. NPDC048819 TaxID=3155268 RepID=UPI0033C8F77A